MIITVINADEKKAIIDWLKFSFDLKVMIRVVNEASINKKQNISL